MQKSDYLNSARVIADHILVEKGMLPYTMEGYEAANRVMNGAGSSQLICMLASEPSTIKEEGEDEIATP